MRKSKRVKEDSDSGPNFNLLTQSSQELDESEEMPKEKSDELDQIGKEKRK